MSSLLQSIKSEMYAAQNGPLAHSPLYYQLYSTLKSAIMNGAIPYDSQMPTEQQLAESVNVSRITAKRAMDELAAENLIARFRGKGSHVTYKYKPQPVRAPLVELLENLIEMGKHSVVRVVSVAQVLPPADIRELLALADGEKIHKVVRVRSNEEGEPYAYYVSYTRGIRRGFTKRNLERKPRLDIIRENEIRLSKVHQVLSAENASALLAESLDVAPGAALLSIRRRATNEDGEIVDILDGWYNPKRFQYAMELSVD